MIILSQNNTDIWCKVDRNIKEILSEYSWKINHLGYPVAYIENQQMTMPRFIMKLKKIEIPFGYVVSYINKNKMDNRFKNLEIVPKNSYNKKPASITKSVLGKYILKINGQYQGTYNSYDDIFEKIK